MTYLTCLSNVTSTGAARNFSNYKLNLESALARYTVLDANGVIYRSGALVVNGTSMTLKASTVASQMTSCGARNVDLVFDSQFPETTQMILGISSPLNGNVSFSR